MAAVGAGGASTRTQLFCTQPCVSLLSSFPHQVSRTKIDMAHEDLGLDSQAPTEKAR